jgi:hypothetical protein
MKSIHEIFTSRVLKIFGELMLVTERDITEYEVVPTIFPTQGPDGLQPNLGFNVAVSQRLVSGDVMIFMGLIEDPYEPEASLKIKLTQLIETMRQQVAIKNAELAPGLNGGAAGLQHSSGGLILPGRG